MLFLFLFSILFTNLVENFYNTIIDIFRIMANKRDLKARIRYACGEIAGECILTKDYVPGIDEEKVDDIVCAVALLQVRTVDRVSVCFDRTVKAFPDKKAYRRARKDYFKRCYAELKKEFQASLVEVVKDMNALLPQEVRDANKANTAK